MQEGRRGWTHSIIMQREGVVRVPFMHAHDKAIDAEGLGMKLLYRSSTRKPPPKIVKCGTAKAIPARPLTTALREFCNRTSTKYW